MIDEPADCTPRQLVADIIFALVLILLFLLAWHALGPPPKPPLRGTIAYVACPINIGKTDRCI